MFFLLQIDTFLGGVKPAVTAFVSTYDVLVYEQAGHLYVLYDDSSSNLVYRANLTGTLPPPNPYTHTKLWYTGVTTGDVTVTLCFVCIPPPAVIGYDSTVRGMVLFPEDNLFFVILFSQNLVHLSLHNIVPFSPKVLFYSILA